jgi:hypothetical protein
MKQLEPTSVDEYIAEHKAGDKVIAKAQSDIWRTATVSKVDGDKIDVKFYDKTKKTLKGNELVRKPK